MAEKIKTLDIPVDGMHCSSCSLVVEKSLNKLDAVESTDVDLNTNKAHITLKGDLDPDLIMVKGNPVDDISILADNDNIKKVVLDGKLVKDKLI